MKFREYDRAIDYATCAACGQLVRLIPKGERNARIPKYYRLAAHRDERGVERDYLALMHAPACPSQKWVKGSAIQKIERYGTLQA